MKNSSPALPFRKSANRIALRFVLLVGVLSFFADFTYEGSRSVLGPDLASLAASTTIVGMVTGFGELAGYGLRLVSERLADAIGRSRSSATSSRWRRCPRLH